MCASYRSAAYYRDTVFPLIERSQPITCDPRLDFEIHVLVCERDVRCCLWSLKTFAAVAGRLPAIVYHDDGTLSLASEQALLSGFPGSRLLRDRDVQNDGAFHEYLSRYPLLSYWRLELDAPYARRLVDFPYYAKKEYIVSIDSDVLFFRTPTQALNLIRKNIPFMCEDYQSAYIPSLPELRALGDSIDERLNAGFFGLSTRSLAPVNVEAFLEKHSRRQWFPWLDGWLEQAIVAVQFTRESNREILQRRIHSLSWDRIGPETCSHHFTGDGARPLLFSTGFRHAHRLGLFAALGLHSQDLQ